MFALHLTGKYMLQNLYRLDFRRVLYAIKRSFSEAEIWVAAS